MLGILLAYQFPEASTVFYLGFILVILLFFILFYKSRNVIFQSPYFAVTTYILFLFLGASSYLTKNKTPSISTQEKNHSSTHQFKVYKKLKPSKYNHRYLASSPTIDQRILLHVDTCLTVGIDTVIYSKTPLLPISEPKNPYQFNYKEYLSHKNIYNQAYIQPTSSIISSGKKSIYGLSSSIRNKITTRFGETMNSNSIIPVVEALLLGQRQEIDATIYTSFSQAGAIHILAISGLHIGVILMLLTQVFAPFKRFKKIKTLIPFIILSLLWLYAFIAGLSPSVVRAVTMFSLLSIAIFYKRKTNSYNTLFISAFILLVINPNYLFDVGFQLSYAAVLSILAFYPLFKKTIHITNPVIKKISDIFYISLAAQIGVLPLSLFYFHQFPGLFMLSNLVIIPLLGYLLGLGFFVICLISINQCPDFLILLLEKSCIYLVQFVTWVSNKEQFIIKEISFNALNLIASYLLILCLFHLMRAFNARKLLLLLTSILFFVLALIYNQIDHQSPQSFIVFNQFKQTLFAHHQARDLYYYASCNTYHNTIKNYSIGTFIKNPQKDGFLNIQLTKNNRILIVDKRGIYTSSFCPTIIYLTQSPRINLNRVIHEVQPELIIWDNNNYKSFQERWKNTCLKQKIPFHSTNEKGYVVIR